MPGRSRWATCFVAAALVLAVHRDHEGDPHRPAARSSTMRLSMLTFIGALVEFITLKGFGTSTFFFITAMCLFDVVAGYTISIIAARRDLSMIPATTTVSGQKAFCWNSLAGPCGAGRGRVFPLSLAGQVAEWLKAHAWKVCNGESRSRVRIPLCPPIKKAPTSRGLFYWRMGIGERTLVRQNRQQPILGGAHSERSERQRGRGTCLEHVPSNPIPALTSKMLYDDLEKACGMRLNKFNSCLTRCTYSN